MQEFNRQELEEKLNLSPKSPVFAHLAYCYLQEGEVERGLEICQSHIVNHKKYGFGHFILGLCLHKTGNSEEALNELEVATYLDPNIFEAWKLLKKLYEERGDKEKTATAKNFAQIWENTETPSEVTGDEFTVDEFIDDVSLDDEHDENILESIDFGETQEESLETFDTVDFSEAEENLEDFDLDDLDTTEAMETTEELLEVKEKIAEEENTIEDIDGLDFDKEMVGEDTNEIPLEESIESFDFDSIDDSSDNDEEEGSEEKEIEDEILSDFSDLEGMDLDLGESLPEGPEENTTEQETIDEELTEVTDISEISDIDDLSDLGSLDETVIDEDMSFDISDEKVAESFDESEAFDKETAPQKETADQKTYTSTLGEIYISQGKFKEALEVFETLLEKKPSSKRFKRKVNELKDLIESQEM